MMLNQSPTDPTPDPHAGHPLKGLRKVSVKFQEQTPASQDPNTGATTPASGPDHGIAEIALESHPPNKTDGGMSKEAAPNPQDFGGGTTLDPLSEALFPHWMRANGVDPEGVDDHTYDYRGVYQQTGGQVHPPGHLAGIADKINTLHAGRHPGIQGMMDMMNGGGQAEQADPIQQLQALLRGGGSGQ